MQWHLLGIKRRQIFASEIYKWHQGAKNGSHGICRARNKSNPDLGGLGSIKKLRIERQQGSPSRYTRGFKSLSDHNNCYYNNSCYAIAFVFIYIVVPLIVVVDRSINLIAPFCCTIPLHFTIDGSIRGGFSFAIPSDWKSAFERRRER